MDRATPVTLNSTAEKNGKTLAYILISVVSRVGNSFIAMIAFKRKTLRKPVDLFIVNMAMSDLPYPIFLFPSELTKLYVGSWLIRDPLGQALCKLYTFIADVSSAVSVQSLVLIAVDWFGAVVFPLRYPLISSKMCYFFIPVTWMVAMSVYSPYLFAHKLVELQGDAVEWSFWTVLLPWTLLSGSNCYIFFVFLSSCWSYFTALPSPRSSHRRFQASNQSTLTNNAKEETERS